MKIGSRVDLDGGVRIGAQERRLSAPSITAFLTDTIFSAVDGPLGSIAITTSGIVSQASQTATSVQGGASGNVDKSLQGNGDGSGQSRARSTFEALDCEQRTSQFLLGRVPSQAGSASFRIDAFDENFDPIRSVPVRSNTQPPAGTPTAATHDERLSPGYDAITGEPRLPSMTGGQRRLRCTALHLQLPDAALLEPDQPSTGRSIRRGQRACPASSRFQSRNRPVGDRRFEAGSLAPPVRAIRSAGPGPGSTRLIRGPVQERTSISSRCLEEHSRERSPGLWQRSREPSVAQATLR